MSINKLTISLFLILWIFYGLVIEITSIINWRILDSFPQSKDEIQIILSQMVGVIEKEEDYQAVAYVLDSKGNVLIDDFYVHYKISLSHQPLTEDIFIKIPLFFFITDFFSSKNVLIFIPYILIMIVICILKRKINRLKRTEVFSFSSYIGLLLQSILIFYFFIPFISLPRLESVYKDIFFYLALACFILIELDFVKPNITRGILLLIMITLTLPTFIYRVTGILNHNFYKIYDCILVFLLYGILAIRYRNALSTTDSKKG